ncbi:MAG: tetratricopeptide repeat protein [Oscillibacter sp.]|jgi:tetratricopeptide repeat protein|nr:tetratricopeptide repeat protein [Oscillibacter sp.]
MGMEEMLKYLDALYANGDHNTAETHLLSWIEEAGMSGARLDLLTLYSELEGLYRVTNRVGQAVDLAERALALIDELGLTHTRHHVTALINCATSLVVQGNTDKALEMFRLALVLIKELGQQETYQAAALYNNISHCFLQKGDHVQALRYLEQALELVMSFQDSEQEIATTKASIALCLMALNRLDQAKQYILDVLHYYEKNMAEQDGHYSAALCAAGEYCWRKGDHKKAISYFERALDFNISYLGDSHGNEIIRKNIEKIKSTTEALHT